MACAIELLASRPFSPGDTILGKILCLFNETEIIEGIKCSLVGEERTEFTGEDDIRHVGLESFLRNDILIMQACTMRPGSYKYPFSFVLPAEIPSSFEHVNGKVVYEIMAEISRGAGRYYRNSQIIQVFVTVDLNDMVHEISMAPVTYPIQEKMESCWLCYSADLFVSLTLEKTSFLIGETIKVKIDIKTLTGLGIAGVITKLLAHTEVTSEDPQTRKFIAVDKIVKKKDDGQEGNSQKVYSFELEVPRQLNVPSLSKCRLIRRRYSVTAIINLNGCYDPIKIPAEIYLGHISVQGPRPIGFSQPPEEVIGPPMDHSSKNVFPITQAPVGNHLPYPIDESYFPSPNRHHVLPQLPTVHLPGSYNVRPEAPHVSSFSASAPPADKEDDALLQEFGTNESFPPPPTYDEAILH